MRKRPKRNAFAANSQTPFKCSFKCDDEYAIFCCTTNARTVFSFHFSINGRRMSEAVEATTYHANCESSYFLARISDNGPTRNGVFCRCNSTGCAPKEMDFAWTIYGRGSNANFNESNQKKIFRNNSYVDASQSQLWKHTHESWRSSSMQNLILCKRMHCRWTRRSSLVGREPLASIRSRGNISWTSDEIKLNCPHWEMGRRVDAYSC